MKRRNLHDLSHYNNTSFDMGELVPVGWYEALPGDSFRHRISALVRSSPLLAPVMHPISVRVHSFFVPFRLLWNGTNGKAWEEFITGGDDGLGGDSGAVPTITVNTGTGWAVGSLADYLGLPTGVDDLTVSALPFRAYSLIWNEYFRDHDLQTALTVNTASGADATTNTTIQKICWEKDEFTAARPWPQKGAEVTLPLGTDAPVVSTSGGVTVRGAVEQVDRTLTILGGDGDKLAANAFGGGNEDLLWGGSTGLETDLSAATAASVAELRRAIALQKYQEARAMYGHEYVDYLQYAFGVTPEDARLQRPEYLGGGKNILQFSEVLQTAPDFDANSGVADMFGHGITAVRSSGYTRFFREHGICMTLMSVRPKTMYQEGIHPFWSRTTKEDFYQKELEFIGQRELLNKELYAAHATPNGTFGYTDRYSEYRHLQSRVTGEFRTTLNHWHLARDFSSDPALNSTFVTCDPGKRINASQSTDQLWVMVNHRIRARRPVSYPSVGRTL